MTVINEYDCRLYGVIPYLPAKLGNALRLFCIKNPTAAMSVTEVRLRIGGAFSLSCPNGSIFFSEVGAIRKTPVICSSEQVKKCVELLCRNSYHTHEGEIKSGYISLPDGFRAGVAPNAASESGVYGINSVCIRIPRHIKTCCEKLLSQTGEASMLIYSPPGVGKTTLLKSIISELCRRGHCVSVIDTRRELQAEKAPLADYICGYPKGAGIELATRTLCPDIIICDEIGSQDTEGIIACQNTGVPLIATCHGQTLESLLLRPGIKELYSMRIFSFFVGLSRCEGEFSFDIFKCS